MTAPAVDVDVPIPDDELARDLEAYVDRPAFDDEPAESADPATSPAPDAPAQADQPAVEPEPGSPTPEVDPNAVPADPASVVDPFAALTKDATPLAYRVNGTDRTHDLILEVPGGGAVVPPDKVDAFRNFVARAESNADAVKSLLADREQVERVGGLEKVYESQEQFAAINAAGLVLLEAIQNPLALVMLDAQGNVVPNAERIAMIRQTADIARREAVYETRSERVKSDQTYRSTSQQAQAEQDALPATIDAQFAAFAAEDRAAAKAYCAQDPEAFTFRVTAQTAAQWGQPVGTLMVRANLIHAYLAERTATRTATTTAQTARDKAAKENATRLAAPRTPVAPKAKAPTQPRAADGTFVEKPRWTQEQLVERILAGKDNDPDAAD